MRLVTFICLAAIIPVSAKDKKPKNPPPQDSIEVVAHIPLTNGPVRRFLTTDHYSSHYLYAEHDASASVTLIDMTKANQPTILAEIACPLVAGSGSLVLVSGTTALMTSDGLAPIASPQTIRILDLSDPQHPKVAREFTGVTAISRADGGFIYLANSEGIWILHQNRVLDPKLANAPLAP